MSFEEQFDKRVKQKIESADFPFDEANWAKAAAFLDADKALTKVGNTTKFVVITLGLVTFISFGTYIALYYKEAAKLANKNPGKFKSEKFESKAKEIVVLNRNSVNIETDSDFKDQTTEQQITSKAELIEVTDKITHPLSDDYSGSETSKNESIVSKMAQNKLNVTSREIQEKTQVQSKIVSPELNIGSSSSNEPVNELSLNSNSQQLVSLGDNNINSAPESTNGSDNSFISPTLINPPSTVNEHSESSANLNTPTIMPGVLSNSNESELSIYHLPSINVGSIESASEIDVKLQNISILQRYEEDYYKKGVKYKTHFFNIEAGVNYWLGWNVTNQKDAKGFDWFAGVNYAYYLSKRIAIGMGFQMFNMNHISQPFYATEKTEYSFSSIKTSTVITTSQLNYLAVPIKMYYRINRFNQVSIGLNTAYVYKTSNKVESVTAESSPVVVQNNIIYNDIQSRNYNLTLSYRVRTYNRLWLSFEGIYGLSDAFHGNLNPSNFERPIGLRIGLQYNIFDK